MNTATKIKDIMESSSVHALTKDIIKMGLEKDCVDAYFDALHATEILKEVMEAALHQ